MQYYTQKDIENSPPASVINAKTGKVLFKGVEITVIQFLGRKDYTKEDITVLDKDGQVIQITIGPGNTFRITGRYTDIL